MRVGLSQRTALLNLMLEMTLDSLLLVVCEKISLLEMNLDGLVLMFWEKPVTTDLFRIAQYSIIQVSCLRPLLTYKCRYSTVLTCLTPGLGSHSLM